MTMIPIHTETIRLSQFLKLANLVGDGVEAKILIQDGEVKVNGEKELRRGRKLRPGDRVEYAGDVHEVTVGDGETDE
jgi:ribosome-associated protein